MKISYCHWQDKQYLFMPKLWPSLICGLLFLILVGLGFWQLHRYHYKLELLHAFEQHNPAQTQPFEAVKALTHVNYIRVKAVGEYDNQQQMVLINQTRHGKVGQDILTPLRIMGDSRLLLVNRGWKQQLSFNQAVKVPDITGTQILKGYLYKPHHRRFILGENIANPKIKPLQMQRIDIKQLSRITGEQYYPYILRLDDVKGSGFKRDWPIVNSLPARHLGYSIQWFAMALVLIIAYLFLSTKIMIKRDVPHDS